MMRMLRQDRHIAYIHDDLAQKQERLMGRSKW